MKAAILGAAHPHVRYALDEFAARDEVELVAAAERHPDMRDQHLGGLADIPVYSDIGELLANHDIDVAVIAGVYTERADATVEALRAGAHVLADKPLCTSLDQLDRIEKAATTASRYVSVMFEKRYHAATLGLTDLLAAGELGDIALVASTGPHKLLQRSRPEWFLRRDGYGGIAADLPVHDIDLVLHLTGASSGTVAALTGNARASDHPEFDDHVAVLLRAAETTATIEANWLGPEAADVHGHYRMRIAGTHGTAELDWAYGSATVTTHNQPTQTLPLGKPRRPAEYFFDALAAGRVPDITTRASLLATKVALLAQESADTGGASLTWS